MRSMSRRYRHGLDFILCHPQESLWTEIGSESKSNLFYFQPLKQFLKLALALKKRVIPYDRNHQTMKNFK